MTAAESQNNVCRVCGIHIPPDGPFLDWLFRGCWPPFCSQNCYDRFITAASEDTLGIPVTVSNAQRGRHSTREHTVNLAGQR